MPANSKQLAREIVDFGAFINNWDDREKWISLPDSTVTPVYLSCRRLVSDYTMRNSINIALKLVARERFDASVTSVIGLATAGIVWGSSVADALELPMGYVRSEKKTYGMASGVVEGNPPQNTSALLVDDTLHTGESLVSAKRALQAEKAIATAGVLTIASLYTGGVLAFANEIDAEVVSLVTHGDLCAAALDAQLLTQSQHDQMMDYYEDPKAYRFSD